MLRPSILWALSVLLVGLSVPGVFATNAQARDFLYDHNGSTMNVQVRGNEVRITYLEPRAGLRKNGVRKGTLLFNGSTSNNYLEGQSRIFSANCGEVDYYVYGDFRAGRDFLLRGAAPVLSGMSCRIVDNVYEGANANLRFTAIGSRQQPTPAPARSGCVTGVNSGLNVRVGPGQDYGRIGEFPASTCGIRVLRTCSGQWCVVTDGRTTGWVHMNYLKR